MAVGVVVVVGRLVLIVRPGDVGADVARWDVGAEVGAVVGVRVGTVVGLAESVGVLVGVAEGVVVGVVVGVAVGGVVTRDDGGATAALVVGVM